MDTKFCKLHGAEVYPEPSPYEYCGALDRLSQMPRKNHAYMFFPKVPDEVPRYCPLNAKKIRKHLCVFFFRAEIPARK